MKKRFAFLLALGLLGSQSACNKFTKDYDVSPNSPSSTTLPLLLSGAELAVINVNTAQITRTGDVFIQRLAGTDQQYQTFAQYVINETDTNNDYNTLYQSGLNTAQLMITKAGSEGSPYYVGIGKILKAMMLGVATDVFGDVPNRQALQGAANFNPAYDPQEIVIQDIQTLLSEGITELKKPASSNKIIPGADDLIHQGNVENWIRAAYIVKARYANRLSRRDPAGSATTALQYLDQAYAAGYTDGSSDTYAVFGSTGANQNQYSAFQVARPNYIKMGKRLVDLMASLNDPRLPLYATEDGAGGFSGTAPDSTTVTTSDIGPLYAGDTSPIPLVTFSEAKFIEAEAALRAGNTGRAGIAYAEAIQADLDRAGVAASDATAYINANGTLGATGQLEQIMTQKYIASFLQVEGWNDYRRTGLPTLTPNPDAVISVIPRRLPTPQDERVNNTNATVVQDLTVDVWWGKP